MACTIAIPRFKEGLLRIYMQSKYTASVRRSGAKAVWIETDDPEKAVAQACQCDGLLLSGGEDVDPAFYGQTTTEKCGKINRPRDETEMKILSAFLATGKPILGICRGTQVLNVAMGGTLYQDLKSQVDGCIRPQQQQLSRYGSHAAMIDEHSKLHEIYGTTKVMVNSFHHQAVKDIGKELIITARASDGVVEGFEKPDHPYFVAVQWHPERLVEHEHHPEHKPLFKSFVDACKK